MELRNGGDGVLNLNCGADHVYRNGVAPQGVSAAADGGKRIASFDGDADRIVYHFFDAPAQGAEGGSKWHLLDGDKITVLFAQFLMEEARARPFLPSLCTTRPPTPLARARLIAPQSPRVGRLF